MLEWFIYISQNFILIVFFVNLSSSFVSLWGSFVDLSLSLFFGLHILVLIDSITKKIEDSHFHQMAILVRFMCKYAFASFLLTFGHFAKDSTLFSFHYWFFFLLHNIRLQFLFALLLCISLKTKYYYVCCQAGILRLEKRIIHSYQIILLSYFLVWMSYIFFLTVG